VSDRIKILLADDHTIVRQGLKLILSAHEDLEVVGEAANGREAVFLADRLRPDIVLMDLQMPELNGIEAAKKMLADNSRIRILVLSMHKESVYVREILKAGARGYILKDAIDTELLGAIRSVARGDGYISPAVAGALNDKSKGPSNPVDSLSARQDYGEVKSA
jgi:DNA-binding NarL/FixJ family response regulator